LYTGGEEQKLKQAEHIPIVRLCMLPCASNCQLYEAMQHAFSLSGVVFDEV